MNLHWVQSVVSWQMPRKVVTMKIKMKNIMGLLMLGTALTATVACNSQKNHKAEMPIEDTEKIDSTLKNQSNVATAIFKAEQARHEADSLINEFKKHSSSIKDIDVNRMNVTLTELSNALGEEANNLKVVTNAIMQTQSNN